MPESLWNGFLAVICDMDGTLIDSEAIHERVEKQVCIDFGLEVPERVWPNYTGQVIEAIFYDLIQKFATKPVTVDQLIQHRNDLINIVYPKAPLYPNAKRFLVAVHEHGRKMALTTSTERFLQEKVFDHHGLSDFFDLVVTGDEVTRGKPDPEPYILTTERLSLDPARCLVIEDSLAGVQSAHAAGCYVIGITHSFKADQLLASGAAMTVNGFAELV